MTLDKSQFDQRANKVVGVSRVPKHAFERKLRDADVRTDRSASVKEGTKECHEDDHANPSNQFAPSEIPGNFTVHAGGRLVIIDIDVPIDDLPEWVANLPETFFTESPHGGFHLYYTVEEDAGISNTKSMEWGSIRYDGWYALGPGSVIDHDTYCGDNCSLTGTSRYRIGALKPIATLSGEHLEHLREACDSSGDDKTSKEDYGGEKITLPDDALAEEGERFICTEFTRRKDTGDLATREIMDFLRGGTGSYELQRDDGTGIDQSAADAYALDMLYGAFLFRGEEEEDARRLTLAVFKRYCWANRFDKTGNVRKWPRRGEAYLQEQMDAVQQDFDRDKWNRWRRRDHKDGFNADEYTPWADPDKDGIPSLITQDTVRATLHILTSDLDPEYVARQYGLDTSPLPSTSCGEMFTPRGSTSSCDSREYPVAREVGEAAAKLNPEREASYLAETVKKLSRKTDEVAHAYCPSRPNGERHVYYPAHFSDPEDARWVKVEGEKRELEAPEQEVMTDGGTPMSKTESHDKLEKIRRAKSGEQSEGPEVLVCPLCDQPMLSEGSLRNHASQSRDDDHRGMTLDDSLEPVEKHKVEETLREQYVEKGKTIEELEEEWGASRGGIHYWLDKYDIERRPHVATRVERASFGLDNSDYERTQSRVPGTRKNDAVQIHQLVAIADGADPERVFSGGEYQCHHRTGISFDNRPENIELLTRATHQRTHLKEEWTEENGFPVLAVQQVEETPRWGPGTRSDSEESIYAEDGPWGPGASV